MLSLANCNKSLVRDDIGAGSETALLCAIGHVKVVCGSGSVSIVQDLIFGASYPGLNGESGVVGMDFKTTRSVYHH
jgi:hypothetical protein